MASAELVGIKIFAHGPFGRASVQSCGLILGVSYPSRPPCRPTWSDQRAGRHAAPAARLLSARGYQWGLSSLMEVQMANKTKCLMCLCLQNHWVTQWFTNDWLWLLLCQRKHLEKKKTKRDSICSSRWDMKSFMLPFRVTNIFIAAHLTPALPFSVSSH